MIARVEWVPSLVREIRNGHWYDPPHQEPRIGVLIHYDASGTDAGAMAWFGDSRCTVSYHYLVLDDGSYVAIAPPEAAAWHAGVCKPSDPRLTYRSANRAFYGIAAATNDKVDVTPLQTLTIAWLTRRYFAVHDWPITDLWRIVGHESEAWPRGRKKDPSGGLKDNPILTVEDIRSLLGRVVL